eukprot:gene11022-23028_t
MQRKSDGLLPRRLYAAYNRSRDPLGVLKNSGTAKNNSYEDFIENCIQAVDNVFPIDDKFTQRLSICSKIANSCGQLPLHIFCASTSSQFKDDPDLELQVFRKIIELNPRSAMQKDAKGNLPIHLAIDRDDHKFLILQQLLFEFPKSAETKNGNGDLPLFLACRRPNIDANVVDAIIQAYPDATSTIVYGCLPLHQLVYKNNPPLNSLRVLIAANPSAAKMPNIHGNLPLHLLFGGKPCIEAVRLLMNAYPEGISYQNHQGETPISKALDRVKKSDHTIDPDLARLVLRTSLHTLPNEDKNILKQLNWNARRDIVLISIKYAPGQENSMLPYLHSAVPGLWRHIGSYM